MAYEYVIKTILFCKIRAPRLWSPGVQGQFTYSLLKIWPRICSDTDKLIYVRKFVVHESNPRKCREIITYKFLTHICWRHICGKTDIGWTGQRHGMVDDGSEVCCYGASSNTTSSGHHDNTLLERDFSWERAIILHSPHRGYVNWCASGHELGPKGTQHQARVFRLVLSASYRPVWLSGKRMRSQSATWSRSAS